MFLGIISSEFSGSVQTPQALILSPTRELAIQIFNECKKFSYKSMLKSGILYGGVDTRYQLQNLSRGCNILVATPGRLMDVLERGQISLEKGKAKALHWEKRRVGKPRAIWAEEVLNKVWKENRHEAPKVNARKPNKNSSIITHISWRF